MYYDYDETQEVNYESIAHVHILYILCSQYYYTLHKLKGCCKIGQCVLYILFPFFVMTYGC